MLISTATQCMELTQHHNKITQKKLNLKNSLITQLINKNKNEFTHPYFSNLNIRLKLLQQLTTHGIKITFTNTEKIFEDRSAYDRYKFRNMLYNRLFIFLNYKTVIAKPNCSNSTHPQQNNIFVTSLIFDNSLLHITYEHSINNNTQKILQQFLGIYKNNTTATEVSTAIQKINKIQKITQLNDTPNNDQTTLSFDQPFITKFIQNQRQAHKLSSYHTYKYNKPGMNKLCLLQLLIDNEADITYMNISNHQQTLLTHKNQPTQFFYDELHFLLNYITYSEAEITINRVLFDHTTHTTTLQLNNSLLHISLKKARPNTLNTLKKLLDLHEKTAYNELLYIPEHEHPFTTENEAVPSEECTLFTSLSCNTKQFIMDIT